MKEDKQSNADWLDYDSTPVIDSDERIKVLAAKSFARMLAEKRAGKTHIATVNDSLLQVINKPAQKLVRDAPTATATNDEPIKKSYDVHFVKPEAPTFSSDIRIEPPANTNLMRNIIIVAICILAVCLIAAGIYILAISG